MTLARVRCFVRGHDDLFAVGAAWFGLKCASCGTPSTGVRIEPTSTQKLLRFQRRLQRDQQRSAA